MKIGPDGSLCRITNSAKDCSNNYMILKIPDSEEQKSSNLNYKLISICPKSYLDESSSDKSDEDFNDKEIENNIEENVKNKETNKRSENNEIKNNSGKNKNFKSFNYRHNRNRRARSRNPPSSRRHYVPSNVNNSKKPSINEDISPWLTPLPPVVNYSTFPIQYPENFQPLNTSLEHIVNPSSKDFGRVSQFGLLGDSPYSTVPVPFQHNQSIPYNPNQNYYSNEYYSNNYQRPVPDRQIPSKHSNVKKYRRGQGYKYWRSKNSQKSNDWNKAKFQRGRGKSSQDYSYDY